MRVKIGEAEADFIVFVALDGGDIRVAPEEIVLMQRIHVDQPGDRTKIVLRNGRKFQVPETVEQVMIKIGEQVSQVSQVGRS